MEELQCRRQGQRKGRIRRGRDLLRLECGDGRLEGGNLVRKGGELGSLQGDGLVS